MKLLALFAVLTPLLVASPLVPSGDALITIVAAENFYGDVARQIGGPAVGVVTILNNPSEDPHLFEASPSTARLLAGARLAVLNGADYDSWMEKLLAVSPAPGRQVIDVAALMHRRPGDDPHLWYDPLTMPVFAAAVAAALQAADPAHRADYQRRLAAFNESLRPLDGKIAELRRLYAGTAVTATEPVFGYMAAALRLVMRNEGFQLAIMNDTEPEISEVAAFQSDLQAHRIALLFYNKQVGGDLTERMLRIAADSQIPTVGITETEPAGLSYQDWMMAQLDAVDHALAAPR